jgi:hypothetical protein
MMWSTCASPGWSMILRHNWHWPASREITATRIRFQAAEQYPRAAAFGRAAAGGLERLPL